MVWILLATAGQFINAIVAYLDKYIVSEDTALPRPFVYAFYSCLLTGGWVVIYLFGYIPGLANIGFPHFENVTTPNIQVVSMSFLTGYTFFMALVSMYAALRKAEAVNVMPVIGVISVLASFGMSYLFLQIPLTTNFIWGVIVLSIGTLLVSQALPKIDTIAHVIHSGVFFALHYITMKGLFLESNFDNAFFWSRIGLVFFALSLLMVPSYFVKIREQTGNTSIHAGSLVVVAKILAGVAAFMLLKATDLGDVTVVQALDGLKFIFILIIGVLFGALLPDSTVTYVTNPKVVMRRLLYILVIAVGYFILFI